MSAVLQDTTPAHHRGNGRPVTKEQTLTDLKVTGSIPRELDGRYVRAGANPLSGTSDLFTLVNRNSNLCLDIYSSSQSDGGKLIQWPCTGSANQQFRLQGVSTGIYKVQAKHSNKCVEIKRSIQSNSALVQQWSCSNAANQQWKVGN